MLNLAFFELSKVTKHFRLPVSGETNSGLKSKKKQTTKQAKIIEIREKVTFSENQTHKNT